MVLVYYYYYSVIITLLLLLYYRGREVHGGGSMEGCEGECEWVPCVYTLYIYLACTCGHLIIIEESMT